MTNTNMAIITFKKGFVPGLAIKGTSNGGILKSLDNDNLKYTLVKIKLLKAFSER